MSVIVAIRTEGGLYVAADSAFEDGGTLYRGDKIFKGKDIITGGVGTHDIVEVARQLARKGNTPAKCGDTESEGVTLLVATREGLILYDDGSPFTPSEDIIVIGDGADVALGALYENTRKSPERRIRRAVEAACYWKASCVLPVKILTL